MSSNCVTCSVRIGVRPNVKDLTLIQCIKCKKWSHSACAGLLKQDVMLINDKKKSWSCTDCDEQERSLHYTSPCKQPVQSEIAAVLRSVQVLSSKLEEQILRFDQIIACYEQKISEMANVLKTIEKGNSFLKKKVTEMEVKVNKNEQK